MAYTSSKAQAGRSTQFLIGALTGSGGTETFTLVGEVSQTNLGAVKWDLVETTNFQSGSFMERMSTVADPGTVSVKGNYIGGNNDPGQVALDAALNAGQPYDFQILVAANPKLNQVIGDELAFSAFVSSGDELTIGVKTAIEFSAELTLTGGRAKTPGSTIVLTANPNPSVHTAPTVLTANFSGTQGANVSGTVQFFDGGTSLGAAEAVSNGTATLSYTFTAGTHNLTAVFVPTANTAYAGATSAILSLIVS